MLPKFVYKYYAKKIIKEYYGKRPIKIDLIARGCYGIVYEAIVPNEAKVVIIKIYLSNNNMCENEATAIKELRKHSSVTMPEVYHIIVKNAVHKHEALIMEKLEGVTLNNLHPKEIIEKNKIADNVISALLSFNKIKGEYFGEILNEKKYNSWEEYYQIRIDEVLNGIEKRVKKGKYSEELYKSLIRLSKEFKHILENENIVPSLIHGDFKPKNVLIKGSEVSGIIDPCDACYGDLAYEARQLTKNNGNEFDLLKVYKQKTANFSNNFEKRRLFYMIFNDIYHMLKSDIYFIDGTISAIKSYDAISIDE